MNTGIMMCNDEVRSVALNNILAMNKDSSCYGIDMWAFMSY